MRFPNWYLPKIKHNIPTEWNWVVAYPENFEVGVGTDIGAFTYIQARYKVIIGYEVQIGGGCKIYSESTIDDKKGSVVLRDGCKIGANSVIMPGITIGENAIVAALSFVNKDIPSNEVWGGIPAKKL